MSNQYRGVFVTNFGGPEVLTVSKSDIPKPLPGQVLVKTRAAGVNPVDTYIRSGNYGSLPTLPYVPGKDGAGEVEEVGEGVSGWKKNDRVWLSSAITGTYAEYSLVHHEDIHPLPEPISFPQGAALWVNYATAYHAIHHIGKVKAGETVLVHGGTGGVGLASIFWASLIPGVTILGTGGTAEGLQLMKKLGVHHVFNHTDSNYINSIAEVSNKKVDVVLEMLANVNLNSDFEFLNIGGRVCVIGNRGTIDKFNPRSLMIKRASVAGVMLNLITSAEKKEIVDAINQALVNNTLNPVLGHIYSLSEAKNAHQDVMQNHLGKIIIDTWK